MTTDIIARIDEQLASRKASIAELEGEIAQLESARAVLTNGKATTDLTPERRGARPRPRSSRRSNGQASGESRRGKVLAVIAKNPGIKTGAIGRALQKTDTYAYPVVRDLAGQGTIRRRGEGWERSPSRK